MVDILFVSQPRIKGIPSPKEIDCSNPQQDFNIQPLGLAYLAGASRIAKCSVDLIDLSILNKYYNWLEIKLKILKPKIIIGGFSTPTIKIDMELGKYAKEYNSKFGIWGPVPSALREFLFKKYPELDFIIENEPEMTMKKIAINLKKNKDLFYNVKGLSYKNKKGKIIWNGYRELEKNLDTLPFPAFDLLPMKEYSTPYNRRKPMTILRTSRGCVAKCTFCITGGQTDSYRGYGWKWRAYSPKRAVDEIEWVVKRFNIREINFFDNEFTIDKKRVVEICKEILKRKIEILWNCEARVDLVDLETLKWMKNAGCYSISFGVEAVNKNVLEKCKKNITPKQVENAVKITKKANIQPALFFIIGLPGETKDSIKETINFAKKMAIKYNLRPQCTIATPYPGTAFYEEAKKNKWIIKDFQDLEQTTACISYPKLSEKELEYWHKQFYKEVVLNPVRIIKRIFRIKHLNEIKSIPIHLKDFVVSYFNKMKYVR